MVVARARKYDYKCNKKVLLSSKYPRWYNKIINCLIWMEKNYNSLQDKLLVR